MHESRHKHATRRPRRVGGRILSHEELEKIGTGSQERADRFQAMASPNSPSEHRVATEKSSTINKDMTMSFYSAEELET